jgi:hypothetical protein
MAVRTYLKAVLWKSSVLFTELLSAVPIFFVFQGSNFFLMLLLKNMSFFSAKMISFFKSVVNTVFGSNVVTMYKIQE